VLQFRILTGTVKTFKIQKDEIRIVLNIVTALQKGNGLPEDGVTNTETCRR
jgi:hypothetical protein